MEKFNELLTKLQSLQIEQKDGCWEENIPDEIWNEYFKGSYMVVATGLFVDTHRWYETSITVINIHGGFLGIEYITNLFSESMDHEDADVTIEFWEMEEQQTITYVHKKTNRQWNRK